MIHFISCVGIYNKNSRLLVDFVPVVYLLSFLIIIINLPENKMFLDYILNFRISSNVVKLRL